MEGVGARLGRSSARYAPSTVFTGPVRKWKKKWVHVPPTNSNNNSNNNHTAANGTSNGGGNSSVNLSLYKWIPITQSQNNDGGSNNGNSGSKNSIREDDVEAEEPPKRKFKYIPTIVLEEQKNESLEQDDDESQPIETDANTVEANSNSDGYDEKPDMNDTPIDENQAEDDTPIERQDLNESTLDLSLA